MFDINRRYKWPIVAPIVPPIQIKHVHSSVSYQQATKYDRRGHKLPSGYGPLLPTRPPSLTYLGLGVMLEPYVRHGM